MRTADNNLWALRSLANFDDVGLEARIWFAHFALHLLGLWQQRFYAAKVEQGVLGIGLLHDARNDVAFAVCVLLKLAITLNFTDALAHHLTESLRCNTTEFIFLWRVIALVDPVAIIIHVVGGECDVHVFWVDADDYFFGCTLTLFVRGRECFNEHLQKRIHGNAAIPCQHTDCFCHIEIAHDSLTSDCVLVFTFVAPDFGVGPHSNTVRARSIMS